MSLPDSIGLPSHNTSDHVILVKKVKRKHFYAAINQPQSEWISLTSIVLYALPNPVPPYEPYLLIRYISFSEQNSDGDSLFLNLQEAKEYAKDQFGIVQADWQELPQEDLLRIPIFVLGKRVHPNDL